MKKIVFLVAVVWQTLQMLAQSTVQNGNWSNPATWGGVPPMGSGNVTINHNVVLDLNYSHTSGTITIGPNGRLYANDNQRIFALNYPNGNANLVINGTFEIPRIRFVSGIITNNLSLIADSLWNSANLENRENGQIVVNQFKNDVGGVFDNVKNAEFINFLNVGNCYNSSSIKTNDLCNSKSFLNNGSINVYNDFSNKDTLASPAVFENNGSVHVGNDWYNGNTITGAVTGKFCIENNSWNNGQMTGSFDFCDKNNGSLDLNTGTIASTITFCQSQCIWTSVNIVQSFDLQIFPNPVDNILNISTSLKIDNAQIRILNIVGSELFSQTLDNKQNISIDVSKLPSGLYFVVFKCQETTQIRKFIIEK